MQVRQAAVTPLVLGDTERGRARLAFGLMVNCRPPAGEAPPRRSERWSLAAILCLSRRR